MKKHLYLFLPLLFIGCSHSTKKEDSPRTVVLYEFPLKKYSKLIEGGFSGLYFESEDKEKNRIFWTLTDRGPNAQSYQVPETRKNVRPFLNPDFTPYLVQFKLDHNTKSIHYLKEIPLHLPDGTPLTGLPNFDARKGRTGDEAPVTPKQKTLPYDLLGIDPEGICIQNSKIWVAEEYGPSVLKFDQTGKLLTRFVPRGYYPKDQLKRIRGKYGKKFIQEIFPQEILGRRLNRGFEGIACTSDKIFTALQSPLPDAGNTILIFEVDTKKNEVTKKFNYQLDPALTDKIGDITFHQNELYIIEQNSKTGAESYHRIFKIALKGSDLKKELVIDLVKSGFDLFDKVEGLTVLPDGSIYVLNDNDFGLTGKIDPHTHEYEVDSNRISVLGEIK